MNKLLHPVKKVPEENIFCSLQQIESDDFLARKQGSRARASFAYLRFMKMNN
jgi:hypothetical protein